MNILKEHVQEAFVLDLIEKFLCHLEDRNALLYTIKDKGISKSCPLSPILGAFYLLELDNSMDKLPVTYCRFMDDICILAKTRWHLRAAIKLTNQIFDKLKISKHPQKTNIGRIKNGFTFLGFQINGCGIFALAEATIQKSQDKIKRLYEQAKIPKGSEFFIPETVKKYMVRFEGWVRGLVQCAPHEMSKLMLYGHRMVTAPLNAQRQKRSR